MFLQESVLGMDYLNKELAESENDVTLCGASDHEKGDLSNQVRLLFVLTRHLVEIIAMFMLT